MTRRVLLLAGILAVPARAFAFVVRVDNRLSPASGGNEAVEGPEGGRPLRRRMRLRNLQKGGRLSERKGAEGCFGPQKEGNVSCQEEDRSE